MNQEFVRNALDQEKTTVSGLGFKNQDITYVQPLQEVLVGAIVSSEREALHIYNDYAYKVGFSVHHSKIHHTRVISLRCKGVS